MSIVLTLFAPFMIAGLQQDAGETKPAAVEPPEASVGREQDSTPVRTRAPSEDDVKASDVSCRNVELVGSRIPRRICRTNAEWALMADENQEAAQNTMRNRGARAHSGTIY